MASFGQIVLYSMIALIIICAAVLIVFFSVAFTSNNSEALSSNVKPIANMGEDEILDCYLYSKEDAPDQFTQVSVTWERKGVEGQVYNYEDGAPQLQKQASQYKGRVHLFPEELSNGNGSLMLRSVRRSDEGEYVCTMNSADHSGKISIYLKTAAFTPPTFKLSDGVLTAVANRWYPEPNVTWMNETGGVLNASTTTTPTPSGIFRVSSTLPSPQMFATYSCRIENSLVMAVGEATLTDTGLSQRTYYTYSLAPPILPSVTLNIMTSLIFICFVT